MGSKASNNFQRNRPESGGTDRDQLLEKSGILEREKQEFATAQKAREEQSRRELDDQAPDETRGDEGPQVE
ncbi:MAG: hypothetical protein ACYC2G_04930 [Gemmatimonadaceae bacterium]